MGLFDKENDKDELKLQLASLLVKLADVREQIGELTKRLGEIDADIAGYKAKGEEYAAYAKKALAAGSEDDARVFLNEKYKLDKKAEELTPQRDKVFETRKNAVDIHDKMVEEINEAKNRLAMLEARNSTADMQIAASKTVNSFDFEKDLSSLETQADMKAAMADAQKYVNGEE